VPLASLARGFARMATGSGLGPERAKAARRLLAACMTEPFHVAGTDRFDTQLMEKTASRIFVKTGAEGVYCAAVPELGLGIAIKCDDGAGRASEVMVAAVLSRLLAKDAAISAVLDGLSRQTLTNWRGSEVGVLRPAETLADIPV